MSFITADQPSKSNSSHLARVPFVLAAGWHSKTVATDPPWYPKHLEWILEIAIGAEEAVRLAVFLEDRSTCLWGLQPMPASTENLVTASFHPYSWAGSDEVQINFGWQRLKVEDDLLKRDPRNEVHVLAPSVAYAGELVNVAKIPTHGITLSILVVAEPDTEMRRRDRRRIKPQFRAILDERIVPLTAVDRTGSATPGNRPTRKR